MKGKRDIFYRSRGILLGALCAMSLMATAEDSDFSYDERLLPVARTFLDLMLCSNVATDYLSDPSLSDKYLEYSTRVEDAAQARGWTKDDLSAALVIAIEEKASLKVKPSESEEEFKRRHYSGSSCQKQLEAARTFIHNGVIQTM